VWVCVGAQGVWNSHSCVFFCVCFCFAFADDCLGIAVDLWSEVTVERADKFEITAEGEGAKEMPKDESNYLVVGCRAAFDAAGKPLPALKYHVVSRIPYARGLGSSSAAIVAGIVAGLVLAGHRLPCWGSEALLQVAAGIEVRVKEYFVE
jgi:homoserine kinase